MFENFSTNLELKSESKDAAPTQLQESSKVNSTVPVVAESLANSPQSMSGIAAETGKAANATNVTEKNKETKAKNQAEKKLLKKQKKSKRSPVSKSKKSKKGSLPPKNNASGISLQHLLEKKQEPALSGEPNSLKTDSSKELLSKSQAKSSAEESTSAPFAETEEFMNELSSDDVLDEESEKALKELNDLIAEDDDRGELEQALKELDGVSEDDPELEELLKSLDNEFSEKNP
jgi:hypothetical protein